MDPDMFTQSDAQYLEKCSRGRVGVAIWWCNKGNEKSINGSKEESGDNIKNFFT